jgi:hypothetical protein
MEKHVMGNFWRACVVLTTLAFTAIAANAQLINSGFETPGTNFIFQTDANGNILTNTQASGWSSTGPSGLAFRTGTNSPASGTYTEGDFFYTYPGINNSGSSLTAHTGGFAARIIGPFTNFCCDANGIFQGVTNSISQVVSNGQRWVVSGYGLNWSSDPMADFGPGVVGFGLIQIAFLNVSNTILLSVDGPHLDTNTVLDSWISCSVTGDSPVGTTQVRAYALHVGMSGALGSIFWDDLSLTEIGDSPPPPPILTNQFQAVSLRGNQVCWPSIVDSSYQPQFSDDNSTWTSIGSPLPGDGNTNCVFGVSHKFYRVLRLQ